ncbi:uncharacterized protein METZ01_LOCUS212434, partial [marine metagenome]
IDRSTYPPVSHYPVIHDSAPDCSVRRQMIWHYW